MAITTTDSVLVDLNLSGKVSQQLSLPGLRSWASYDQLRVEVESAIKDYLKWEVEEVSGQIDYYDGNGEPSLPLRRPWIQSITNVWSDPFGAYGQGPTPFADPALTNGTNYVLKYDGNIASTNYGKSGLLICLRGSVLWMPSDYFMAFGGGGGLSYGRGPVWPEGIGNLKVTYVYGFSAANMPASIKLAVATMVSIVNNSVKYGAMVSNESLARYSYSLALSRDNEMGSVRQLLSRYRDLTI